MELELAARRLLEALSYLALECGEISVMVTHYYAGVTKIYRNLVTGHR